MKGLAPSAPCFKTVPPGMTLRDTSPSRSSLHGSAETVPSELNDTIMPSGMVNSILLWSGSAASPPSPGRGFTEIYDPSLRWPLKVPSGLSENVLPFSRTSTPPEVSTLAVLPFDE